MPEVGIPLEIGKGRIMRTGSKVALLSFGARLGECLKAADDLEGFGLSATVADARFMKPLDLDMVLKLAREHEVLITIEEGSIGGFGTHVLQTLADHGALDRGLKVRTLVLPDTFIDQDSPAAMLRAGRPRRQGHRKQGFRSARQGSEVRDGEAGLVVRFSHLHPASADTVANVRIKEH